MLSAQTDAPEYSGIHPAPLESGFSFEPSLCVLFQFQHPHPHPPSKPLVVITSVYFSTVSCSDPQITIVGQVEPAFRGRRVAAKEKKKETLEETTKPRLVSTVDSLRLTDRCAFLF